jgi:hypothetical protein
VGEFTIVVVESEVLKVARIEMAVFWVVSPRNLIQLYRLPEVFAVPIMWEP